MFTTGNEIVDKVGMINLEGNIIPHAWYQHFKMPNGKPDLNSMIILSEIVYWYRPTTLRDENTGRVTGIKKRFKADLLQRSYDSFAEQFGLTKRQVKEAIDRLCAHGVIWREFRTLKVDIVLNNVLYIGINPKLLCDVSFVQASTTKRNTLLRSNVPPSNDKTSNPDTLESETNTEITTEITSERETRENSQTENPVEENLNAIEVFEFLKKSSVFGSELGIIKHREPNISELNVLIAEVTGYWSGKYLSKQQLLTKILSSVSRKNAEARIQTYTVEKQQATTDAPVINTNRVSVSPFAKFFGR